MLTHDELQSKTIAFLRFPLIVGVVLIHSEFSNLVIGGVKQLNVEDYPVFYNVSYLFSDILAGISVPLFFFISGFLFFYRTEGFGTKTYLGKLKKRARTLLMPYVFWNLLMLLFYLAVQTFMPELMSGRNKLVADYTPSDWLWAFWNTEMINHNNSLHQFPFNYPFWFIRDLMVAIVISPLVYWWVKKLKLFGVALLGALWITGFWPNLPGLSITALFFFSAGAWFSIHKKNFVETLRPCFTWSVAAYILIVIILLWLKGSVEWTSYLQAGGILAGIVCAITLSAHYLDKGAWRASSFLAGSSFFVYAYHAMPLAFAIKILFKAVQPHSELIMLSLYFLSPALVIVIGLAIYFVLKHWLPALLVPMTGGR